MSRKEYKQNPTPWWVWVLVGIVGVVTLFIAYLTINIYFFESDEEIKRELGFYDDFSKTDYDKYYPDYDIVYLVENNFIDINRNSHSENEYGLNRENRIFSIIMNSGGVSEFEVIMAAKTIAIGAKDIADNYSVQVFFEDNLKEPVIFLHNAEIIYSATDKSTSLKDIEKYK